MLPPSGPVLVVDDDEAVRHSLKFALELEGLDVRLYEDAEHLLREDGLPGTGCLVVDYQMPGMNGVELVGRLRGHHVGLPAILISGRVTEELRQRAVGAGFHLVLEKPLIDGSLLAGIHDALEAPSRGHAGGAT
ncbi:MULTISPECIES: response regulator transcription factor [unclassified Methylobacterium]|jgi:FixJ family two-component response regulator|uniref:response regulator transcription factor n=1 Tax=unclassified Methylobacterium TaxID=2615210 RepID=UPI00135409AC|nr:response regulator [Methylobacterium sp. 2A]MWV23246.1 response regulator [Methylobacterium sp. 2A]